MNESKYLENLITQSNIKRKLFAKRMLKCAVLFLVIALTVFIGLSLLNSEAKSFSIIFSSIFGLVGFIYLIKFLLLSGQLNEKIISKCEKQIKDSLKADETLETFYNDISTPAFGEYVLNDHKVFVGNIFVLFQSVTPNGPRLNILRGDNLGQFNVHYFSREGDIGVDINDKNGKFIRSAITSNKDEFYSLLNGLENIKSFANGEYIPNNQVVGAEDNEFVEELKNKVSNHDKKRFIKIGIYGILFGIFLVIASSSSGIIFAYAGLALIILSIIFIVIISIKYKKYQLS